MPRQFRIQAKFYSLTYPKCPIEPMWAKQFLLNRFKTQIQYVCVAKELHQDGEPHLHALLQFKRRHDVQNQDHFDIIIPTLPTQYDRFHPNIQKTKFPLEWKEYIQKDGEFLEEGELIVPKQNQQKESENWKILLETCKSSEEFLTAVRKQFPKTYCLHLQRLEYVAQKEWPVKPPPYVPTFTQFPNLPWNVQHWVDTNCLLVSMADLQHMPSLIQKELWESAFTTEGDLLAKIEEHFIDEHLTPDLRNVHQSSDPEASSSRAPPEPERLNGQEVYSPGDIIITPDIWT